MKNMFYLFGMVLIIWLAQSCSNFTGEPPSPTLKEIEDYYFLGDIHNEYIQNIEVNFSHHNNLELSQAVEVITEFHAVFEPTDETLSPDLSDFFANETAGITYLDPRLLQDYIESEDVEGLIDTLLVHGLIDLWEKSMLLQLIYFFGGNPTFEELSDTIDVRIDQWESQQYINNTDEGDISGGILAIARKSTDFWLANPELIYDPDARIAPWIVADVVGAIVGTALYSGGWMATHNGSIDGCCDNNAAVVAAVGGAVLGSTGIVGKAGKWLSKWLTP